MVIHETNLIELIIKQMPVFSGAYCNDRRNNILGLKLSPECSQVSTSSLHKTKQLKKKERKKERKKKRNRRVVGIRTALCRILYCM